MSEQTGQWLVQKRMQRGWDRRELAGKLIEAGKARGIRQLPDVGGMVRDISRWEGGGHVSHTFVRLYCDALDIVFAEFPQDARTRAPHKDSAGPCVAGNSFSGSASIKHEVMMAADQSRDHAADRARPGIDDITVEQLQADMSTLSRLTDAGAPLTAFTEARKVRDRITDLMDRRLWPREETDLYRLLSCTQVIMSQNARRLGYHDAAEGLLWSGFSYANIIEHNPLRGLIREQFASLKYWRGQFRQASEMAAGGVRYMPRGRTGAALHNIHARALARMGDPGAARRAVGLARDAWDDGYRDDLVEIGGFEFGQILARLHLMAGEALADADAGADGQDAAGELERAISLFDEPQPDGEQYWSGAKPLAGINLALVRLRSGELDGAATALHPALTLPPEQRSSEITTRLAIVRDELARPPFRDSPQSRTLGDRIENFTRETVNASLRSLSG
jgi:hypothetical protein